MEKLKNFFKKLTSCKDKLTNMNDIKTILWIICSLISFIGIISNTASFIKLMIWGVILAISVSNIIKTRE